jgi:hypothetical protein
MRGDLLICHSNQSFTAATCGSLRSGDDSRIQPRLSRLSTAETCQHNLSHWHFLFLRKYDVSQTSVDSPTDPLCTSS